MTSDAFRDLLRVCDRGVGYEMGINSGLAFVLRASLPHLIWHLPEDVWSDTDGDAIQ